MTDKDTIAAIATPAGRGGVGIVRVSGSRVRAIAEAIVGCVPKPRFAHYARFVDAEAQVIDIGIVLYFPNPTSFTGEDVLELQAHGGPIILERLLMRVCELGARLARPGEFSERAFLNDKIDLAQAEAIADLIDSASVQASRSAMRSLQGEFSQYIHNLVEQLIQLRIYVEAALDFPEEEIDFLTDGKVGGSLAKIIAELKSTQQQAQQGALLREGIRVVIAGEPNAGKSTLLNRLSGRASAIVTDIPGTTRDLMHEHITIDGIPINIIDTAGLRDSVDIVEIEGIKRTRAAMQQADMVLLIEDVTFCSMSKPTDLPTDVPILTVKNKCDLTSQTPLNTHELMHISAKTGEGIEDLRQAIKQLAGYQTQTTEVGFMARRRHLEALAQAEAILSTAQQQFNATGAGELLAEDLRQAQHHLATITGEFSSDDLLGRIFSSFCIGK